MDLINRIKNYFANLFENLLNRIKNLKSSPLKDIIENIIIIIIYLIWVFMVVIFLISFVVFIVNGGYSSQINILKTNGFAAVIKTFFAELFTTGAVPLYYSYVSTVYRISFVLSLVLLYALYIVSASKGKRIAMISLLSIAHLLVIIGAVLFLVNIRAITLSDKLLLTLLELLPDPQKLKIIILVFCATIIGCFVAIFIMLIKSDLGWFFTQWFFAAVAALAAAPLLLLLIENIIPLALVVILLVIIVLMCMFIPSLFSQPETLSKKIERLESKIDNLKK